MNVKKGFAVRSAVCFLVIVMVLAAFCGCKGSDSGSASGDAAVFTDSAGREVELPEKIEKVATLGTTGQIMMLPLAPEMMIGINAPIEVDSEKYLSAEYSDVPVIGQYYGQRNLNTEELAQSDADVIIDLGDTKENVVSDMDEIQSQTGIPTIHINATLETAPEAFRTLGELLDKKDRAEELAACCENIYDETSAVLDKVGDNKLRILSCTGSDGFTVTEKDSSHSEILDMVGINVADIEGNGGIVDIEQIHIWDPDVVLFLPGSIYSSVGDMPEWNTLGAIKNGNCYEVPEGPYCWNGYPPTVNRYLGLLWMTATFYPDQCDYDLKKEVKEYYSVFYGCKLTDKQYDALVSNAVK